MRILLHIAILGSLAHPLMAQDTNGSGDGMQRRTTLGGGLEIGIPMGAFGDSWGQEIVGLSANLAIPMRLVPLDWGFDFAWGSMGSEREDITLDDPAFQGLEGNLAVNSNIYGYHGLLRLKPFNGMVSPYVEGLVGFRHFSTRSKLRVDGSSEPLETERRSSDVAGSTGWAVGVQVAPGEHFYLEARVERLNGGKVNYVDPRTIDIGPSGEVTYETLSSPTRTVNVHLGIGIRF